MLQAHTHVRMHTHTHSPTTYTLSLKEGKKKGPNKKLRTQNTQARDWLLAMIETACLMILPSLPEGDDFKDMF